MYILIVSTLLFVILLTVFYFACIYNNIKLKEKKKEVKLANQTQENLKYIYYSILGRKNKKE